MADAHVFLAALFGDKPNKAAVAIWHKDTHKTHYYADTEAAAEHVLAQVHTDVYVAAGLGPRVERPSKNRVPATRIVGIPGCWADIDVVGGPEDKQGAAPNIETAMALAHYVLEPTIIVNSGYGIQPWWLLEDGPWCFRTDEERKAAARIVKSFQLTIGTRAKELGFGIDPTADLARLMRVPGAFNHKGEDTGWEPVPVTIVYEEGPRYNIEELGQAGAEHLTQAVETMQRGTGDDVEIELRGEQAGITMRILELQKIDATFSKQWERRKVGEWKDWSDSSFDMAIASRLAMAGASDQEMADAIVFSRLQFGDEKDKAYRKDYISRTIARARVRGESNARVREREEEQEYATDMLVSMAETKDGVDVARTTTLFSQVLGGPEVKELIQDGRDPDIARYRLSLADGREVPIGPSANLLSPDTFRSRFMDVTGHIIPGVKREKWFKIIQALLHTATINEGDDDTRSARARAWIRDYLERGMSTDRNMACQMHEPFSEDGEAFVALGPFAAWLRKMRSERIVEADLKTYLIAAGWERRTVAYTRDSGKRSSRSYFVGPNPSED